LLIKYSVDLSYEVFFLLNLFNALQAAFIKSSEKLIIIIEFPEKLHI